MGTVWKANLFDDRQSGDLVSRIRTDAEFRRTVVQLADIRDALDQTAIVALTDRNGIITYVNERFCDISKYNSEELIGRTHRKLNSGVHGPDFFKNMWHTIRRGRVWRGEICNRAKDGERYWVDTIIVPLLDEAGEPYQYVSIGSGVTERKKAEERVRKSERKYFTLLMNMPAGCAHQEVVYDEFGRCADFRFADMNAAFADHFGIRRDDVVGKPYSEVRDRFSFPPGWGIKCCEIAESGGTHQFGDFYCARTARWLTVSVFQVERGQFAFIAENITERKRNEQEIERARSLAEAANHAKSQFLANVGHEVRTPLNGILGLTELTLLTDLDKEQRENLTIVKTCADTLRKVIEDVLDLAKIETGKLELERVPFHLKRLVDKTVAAYSSIALEKKLNLIMQFYSDVPDRFSGDPGKIRQILQHLVANAIKFTESGSIVVSVKKAPDAGRRLRLLFRVEDTGIGIAPEDMDRLFRSFSQVDGTFTRKYGGTGLGLAIAKRLVERMGGTLWVESEPGVGSAFSFTLEMAEAEEAGTNG